MISPEVSTAVTILIFVLATIAGFWGILARNAGIRRAACLLAVSGFVCQTAMLGLGFHKAGLSVGAYMQLLAWFLVLCGIGVWAKFRQDAILLFAAPLSLFLFASSSPLLGAFVHVPNSLHAPFFALHIGSLLLSLALLLVGAVASLLFLVLQGRIKNKHSMKGFWQDIPALSMLEKISAVATGIAFPLYTLGIAAGLFWAKPAFGASVSGDPKEIVSILVWLMFAILFYGRFARAWKGRRPARLTVAIFLISMLSIFLVNGFLDSHHSFNRI